MELGLIISIAAVVAGIAILIWPRLLNYTIAAYLIITGIIGSIDILEHI